MTEQEQNLKTADSQLLKKMVEDAFRRIVFHYGAWHSEVQHHLGAREALAVEETVWKSSAKNQLERLGKTMDFPVEDGLPAFFDSLSREQLLLLLKSLAVNWLANDGIWFQAVENRFGMVDAKRCNDACWSRYSPFEAERIKEMLGLPDNGGIPALKKALSFRLYALINEQSCEDAGPDGFIFRMDKCRVQAARKRKGLEDYPCKSAGMVEYPYFARTIDDRFRTECVACPPDEHPEEWFCAWKFVLETRSAKTNGREPGK
jgi:hypothetical protein